MRHDSADRIEVDIALRCVDAQGNTLVLRAGFGYDPGDPFAVTMTFRTQWGEVVWAFARDLLSRGISEPVGDGDVHVWPCLDAEGSAVVMIELSSPDGELLVQASAREVAAFLRRTLAVVPAGTESNHVDVDDLINQLLGV